MKKAYFSRQTERERGKKRQKLAHTSQRKISSQRHRRKESERERERKNVAAL